MIKNSIKFLSQKSLLPIALAFIFLVSISQPIFAQSNPEGYMDSSGSSCILSGVPISTRTGCVTVTSTRDSHGRFICNIDGSSQSCLNLVPAAPTPTNSPTDVGCGTTYNASAGKTCNCVGGSENVLGSPTSSTTLCCGWVDGSTCYASASLFDNGVTQKTLDAFDPLKIGGSDSNDPTDIQPSALAGSLTTPGAIITRLLTYIFPIGGLVLFIMIVWGGFEMMTGSASKKSIEEGKKRVTAAIVGFLLLFSSYWITQLVSAMLKVDILGV